MMEWLTPKQILNELLYIQGQLQALADNVPTTADVELNGKLEREVRKVHMALTRVAMNIHVKL